MQFQLSPANSNPDRIKTAQDSRILLHSSGPELQGIDPTKFNSKFSSRRTKINDSFNPGLDLDRVSRSSWFALFVFWFVFGGLGDGFGSSEAGSDVGPQGPSATTGLATTFFLLGRPNEALP